MKSVHYIETSGNIYKVTCLYIPDVAKTSATELLKFKNSISISISRFTFGRFNNKKKDLNLKLFNIK